MKMDSKIHVIAILIKCHSCTNSIIGWTPLAFMWTGPFPCNYLRITPYRTSDSFPSGVTHLISILESLVFMAHQETSSRAVGFLCTHHFHHWMTFVLQWVPPTPVKHNDIVFEHVSDSIWSTGWSELQTAQQWGDHELGYQQRAGWDCHRALWVCLGKLVFVLIQVELDQVWSDIHRLTTTLLLVWAAVTVGFKWSTVMWHGRGWTMKEFMQRNST